MDKIDTERIPFLGTYIDNVTAAEAKMILDFLVQSGGTHYIVTPNTDTIVKFPKDPLLRKICNHADLLLADGQMLVKISKYLGTPLKERVCMTDFVWDVMDLASEKGYKVFLFGGKPDVLHKAKETIKERYPKLYIVGSYSPPFGFEKVPEQTAYANKMIKQTSPDILLVFLGCPKQEKFIAENKDKYQASVSITMGGCVDFIAGRVKRAPGWMQKAGLEWFYRFIQEPGRLFHRYFIDDMQIFRIARKYKKRYLSSEI